MNVGLVFLIGILLGICVTLVDLIFCKQVFNYKDLDIIVKIFTGIAPFVAAYSAYYMWSKNREKELKKIDYRNDYYKKILDKRICAYEKIERIAGIFKKRTEYISATDVKLVNIFSCFKNRNHITDAISIIGEADSYLIWLTPKIRKTIEEINILLIEAFRNASLEYNKYDKETDDVNTIRFGLSNEDKLIKLRDKLNSDMYYDWTNLYEIDQFLDKSVDN